jgi:hypothetical protein
MFLIVYMSMVDGYGLLTYRIVVFNLMLVLVSKYDLHVVFFHFNVLSRMQLEFLCKFLSIVFIVIIHGGFGSIED